MGAENKGEGKKEESKSGDKKEDEQKSKEEEVQEIVLKVDMHCEACARKVARSLRGFTGVEEVTADCKASKVVVKAAKGVDPVKVCERVQKKSGRKVDILSPLPPPPKEEPQQEPKPPEDPPKKVESPPPPPVITVVLQVAMHCEACAQVMQKRIRKIKGVESVETDITNDRVIVKGVIDNPDHLVQLIYKRTRKQASIVKEEEKQKPEQEDDKKPADDAEKKQGDDKKDGEGGKAEDEDKNINGQLLTKSEYWPSRSYMECYYANYAPQMFSDENPNACYIM